MFAFKSLFLASTLFLSLVKGDIVPTSPDGSTVVQVGSDIKALWTADTTGQWGNVEVQLMTGDNLQMVPLATLATGIDGTSSTGLDIPCPDVTPYSKIYFLQFTQAGNASSATWTTRFTIAGADGSTTPPTNETTYSGNPVQWGTGALVGEAPTPLTGSSASNSTNASFASPSGGFISITSIAPISTPSAASSQSMTGSVQQNAVSASSVSRSASASASAAPAATSTGAALRKSTVGLGAIILGLAGAVAI